MYSHITKYLNTKYQYLLSQATNNTTLIKHVDSNDYIKV